MVSSHVSKKFHWHDLSIVKRRVAHQVALKGIELPIMTEKITKFRWELTMKFMHETELCGLELRDG